MINASEALALTEMILLGFDTVIGGMVFASLLLKAIATSMERHP